ncbi:MAG TPA: YitT family protein [Candidatus Rifleibacterium sp.]|nr:YitT family protein [Candidatus Rifleibacterium sp.]HPT46876.1 YitT family protein [Candidatus Rifleibacterium sp.]
MKKIDYRSTLKSLVLLLLGSCICAVAVNGILVPKHFLSGGLTGVTLFINRMVPSLPVSGMYFAFNIPLFIFGYRLLGGNFFMLSFFGTAFYTIAIGLIDFRIAVNDMMLSAILAGLINGVGSGIILRSRGSAGGTDILSVLLASRFGIKLGTTLLTFNIIVLTCVVVFFSIDEALFTLVFMFVSSRMIDLVIYGLSQRKAVTIVSERWQEINGAILEEMQRGTTLIAASGGFSQQPLNMIYTVVSRRELHQLKEVVLREDPGAFVVVNETSEVIGNRIGNQPQW